MKRRAIWRRIAAAAVCLLLFLSLPQTALAYSLIPDIERECSLTLKHKYPNTTFDLYRIASVTQDVEFTLVPDLSGCNVLLTDLDQEGWRDAALTLAGYVEREKLEPLRTGKTGEDGTLTFEKLATGLYLVIGEHETRDGMSYHFTPFLVCLPNWLAPADDPEGEKDWTYDVTMNTKYEEREPDREMRRVLKVWNDAGEEELRPPRISVDLLQDGEIYDTVILTADNNWRYVWEDLETGYDWRVVESAGGEGYNVSVSYEGVTFIITNSTSPDLPPKDDHDPPPPPPPPDEPPDEPPDNPPPPPEIPPEPNIPIEDPDVPRANREPEYIEIEDPEVPLAALPQTGQLWWPVPLLAMSGMCLFVLGWASRRKDASHAER